MTILKTKKMAEMTEEKRKAIMECDDFEQLLEIEYGKRGEPAREQFEHDAQMFILAECVKEQRESEGLTQQQFAEKVGTQKSVISKLERGNFDIKLPALFSIFQKMGKRISFSIA